MQHAGDKLGGRNIPSITDITEFVIRGGRIKLIDSQNMKKMSDAAEEEFRRECFAGDFNMEIWRGKPEFYPESPAPAGAVDEGYGGGGDPGMECKYHSYKSCFPINTFGKKYYFIC